MRRLVYEVNGTEYTTYTEAVANGYDSNYHNVRLEDVQPDEKHKLRCAKHRAKVERKLAEI